MPLLVNLCHLESDDAELKGELSVPDLALDVRDEMVRVEKPLSYNLTVQKLEQSLLLQGGLNLTLACQCVRCLKPFSYQLRLKNWTRHVSLEGEEKAPVAGDLVDLTPYLREDILLEFPQHPLCQADCRGLPKTDLGKAKTSDPGQITQKSSAWTELDKLKL